MSDFCFHLRCESLKLFFSFFFGRNTSTLQHFLACVNKRYGIDLFSLASPKTSRESIQIKIFFFSFLTFLAFFLFLFDGIIFLANVTSRDFSQEIIKLKTIKAGTGSCIVFVSICLALVNLVKKTLGIFRTLL